MVSAGALGSSSQQLLEEADAYLQQGQFRAAEAQLLEAKSLLSTGQDRALATAIEADLAIALGRPTVAERELNDFLNSSPDSIDTGIRIRLYGTLGVSRALLNNFESALPAFEQAADLAIAEGLNLDAGRALANAGKTSLDAGEHESAKDYLTRAETFAHAAQDDAGKGNLLLNIGRSWIRLGNTAQERLHANELYGRAAEIGRSTGSLRLQSYASGYAAELYEFEERWSDALSLNRQAAFLAQEAQAEDVLFLWEWGSARTLDALGRMDEAQDSYVRAVDLLEILRHQLPFLYGQRGEEFQSNIEPIYFGLADSYLKEAQAGSGDDRQSALLSARDTVEKLKAAELRNYFGDDCVQRALERSALANLSDSALIIYPIALDDRLEILVTLPDGDLTSFNVGISSEELETSLKRFRELLEKRITREYLLPAQQLYQVLIEPLEPLLTQQIDTLVFVPHGYLMTVPMAALHDGKRHLIERFAVAVTPGLELTDPAPLSPDRAKLLLAGLSRPVGGYPTLSHVPAELNNVSATGSGQILLDESFQLEAMSSALTDDTYNIVHIATHGEFGSDSEQSFLLAYDGRLEMVDLERYVGLFRYRQQPLELLTLSACDTATGNQRAALGLSGIAVKAGARSAVGTLWRVNDQSSAQLMTEFYSALTSPGTSRARALQLAQLGLIEDLRYWHPGYWSAFLLISNWL